MAFDVMAEGTNTTVEQELYKMSKAMHNLNYEISFVQTSPSDMDSFVYRHIKQGTKVYAQLVTLDGDQQEIIQRGNLVSYFQANAKAFTINTSSIIDSLPTVLNADFAKLSKNYDFIKLGKDRVAGRIVDVIRIVPKDHFRYQYLLFIDEKNSLLLRADMLDREGNLLNQFRVITLYIDDRLRGLIDYLNKVSMPPLLKSLQSESPVSFTWKASWLPQGFKLIHQNKDLIDGDMTDNAFFSDGLFTFTLFVSDAGSASVGENSWHQGAYTIYSEVVGNKEVTFIGQLPVETAKQIVQDVMFSN